jgi:hypothetical protein
MRISRIARRVASLVEEMNYAQNKLALSRGASRR